MNDKQLFGLIADSLQAQINMLKLQVATLDTQLRTHAHDMLAMQTYSPHTIAWTGTALWHKDEEVVIE